MNGAANKAPARATWVSRSATGIALPIKRKINQLIVRSVGTSEARERLANLGVEAVASTPDEFAAKMRSEISVIGKVIRDAGIRAD